MIKICVNCQQHKQHKAKGLCQRCYRYKQRTGNARPLKLWCRVKPDNCKNCSVDISNHPITLVRKGLCNPCYMYEYRHGITRPKSIWKKYENS